MISRVVKSLFIISLSLFLLPAVHAQLGKITIDLEKDKPEKFKTKVLKSEKTGQKKFTLPRRFVQNTVSHYNYYFNANNKINEVIERARIANKDDYSKLLPFYGYSLDNTASQSSELDSVIYKATAGILLHDLRSDWVDNLYLLIGKAYYLRKDFDSASMTFQFINYNLFPRKKKNEDDQLIVGSNDNGANSAISISSKENRNIIDKAFTRPPSRNDALVWQVRTLIEINEYSEAAGLISTLQNDPVFPGRLDPALEEMSAYWFYTQQMYDSTLIHLENSLSHVEDMQDKARREYLLAQLYEITNHQDTAAEYYDKAIKHTTDPLMDIYANLNKAKMLKSNDPAEIDRSIATLLRLSKKDKYETYRDIIFFSAAELAMTKPDTSGAVFLFKKSTFYNQENISFKNRAFLNLAEISYKQKNYKDAYAFYDSLQLADTTLGNLEEIQKRRNALAEIVDKINIIEREDSLQLIAAMTPANRDAFLKKLSKKLQKETGLKDEDLAYGNSASDFFNTKNASADLFNSTNTKGDWYFYNNSVKAKGYNEFKRVWGKRQNVDNWRRISSGGLIGNNSNVANPNTFASPDGDSTDTGLGINQNGDPDAMSLKTPAPVPVQQDISVEGLLANVPVTKQQLDISNTKISTSLFELGKNYQTLLEDYDAAVETYERSLQRFPDSLYNGELYLNLSYCYRKLGNLQKADYYKNLLLNKFDKSKYARLVTHPEAMEPSKKDPSATKRYEEIYNLFIEGNFEAAIKEKEQADSLYGASYWSPQLLYIESVYYIRKKDDSTAIKILEQITTQYPGSSLNEKATTMIDVLKRRSSIENYLTNLTVERAKEDSQIIVYDDPTIMKNAQPGISNNNNIQKDNSVIIPGKVVIDSSKLRPPVSNATFTFDPLTPQNVIMVLNKVDPVYSSEAKNAFSRYNREKFSSLGIAITKDTLDKDRTLLVFAQFLSADEAIKYRDRLKKDAPAEISWLPAEKYSFYIISGTNLDLLKQNKNLQSYIDLLNTKYPGKF